MCEPWFQNIAKFVGKKSSRMHAAGKPSFETCERRVNLIRSIGPDDLGRVLKQHRDGIRARAVIEQHKALGQRRSLRFRSLRFRCLRCR